MPWGCWGAGHQQPSAPCAPATRVSYVQSSHRVCALRAPPQTRLNTGCTNKEWLKDGKEMHIKLLHRSKDEPQDMPLLGSQLQCCFLKASKQTSKVFLQNALVLISNYLSYLSRIVIFRPGKIYNWREKKKGRFFFLYLKGKERTKQPSKKAVFWGWMQVTSCRAAGGQLARSLFTVSCLLVVQPATAIKSEPTNPNKNHVFCWEERKNKVGNNQNIHHW